MIRLITALTLLITFFSCKGQDKINHEFPISKTNDEWKSELSKMEYYVLRQSGTERAFTGEYYNHHEEGTYYCAGCNSPLYKSENKFNSGTGWPSFDQAIPNSILIGVDYDLGYSRNELKCATCGGHLGHVFNDGPTETTGQRHCINSVALDFKKL